MTTSIQVGSAADGGPDPLPRRRGRVLIGGLAVTQTIGYGTCYYAGAVLLTPLAAELHTSTSMVTGAFTASILTGAALAVPVGRRLDRRGGRALMTTGSTAATLLLLALANVTTVWQLYAVYIGIGAATAASLYEAAFAVVIGATAPDRRRGAILGLTVIAGFSSSIFLPTTGWLVDAHGWRTAVLTLAVVQAATIPIHATLVPSRVPTPPATHHTDPTGADRGAVRQALRDPGFWLLAAGFTAHTAAISALTVHLVAALISWGHPPTTAATIAGLLGLLSVAGRLLSTGLQRRYPTTIVTAAIFAVQAAAATALPVIGHSRLGATVGVIAFGIGFGVATIAKPVLLAERYDTTRYGTIAGALVVPATLAKAAAPLAAAALHTTGSYTPVLIATGVACAIAAGLSR